jgi:hypothetical protein
LIKHLRALQNLVRSVVGVRAANGRSTMNRIGPALAASLLVAQAAAGGAPAARDSGVGPLIAAQGNAAIRQIQAEARAAVTAVLPALPRPAAAALAGAGTAVAAQVRCAQ